jgi:hypothetical protein
MSAREPDGIYVSTTHPTNPERYVAMQKTVEEISHKKKAREPLLPNALQQAEEQVVSLE